MTFSQFTFIGFVVGLFFGGSFLAAGESSVGGWILTFAAACYVAQLGRNRLRERRWMRDHASR